MKELAVACSIPEDAVPSVLTFYHDLSVFFHYTSVPSLASKVIASPQWLIRQMAKILALEGFEEYRNDNLWKLLREDGILVEPLYREVLKNQELEAQAIIDLLEHFLIIAPIHTSNKHKCAGREYFVPCMLPPISSRVPDSSNALQSAAPLHLIFSTNYRPPGFFPRLAAILSKHPNFHVNFDNALLRNKVTFHYGSHQIDRVIVTEEKSSVCVQVERISQRPHKYAFFPVLCQHILQIVRESFTKVKEEWFPGINVSFALECHSCQEKDHFIDFPSIVNNYSHSTFPCQEGVMSHLTKEQKCWLDIDQVSPMLSCSYVLIISYI